MTILDAAPTTPGAPAAGPGDDRNGTSVFAAATFAIVSVVLAALVLAVLAVGVIALVRDDPAPSTVSSTTIDVALSEFAITGNLTAPPGQVTLAINNVGSAEHNLSIADLGVMSDTLAPGATQTLSLGNLTEGTYEVICTIPGHDAAGMKATLVIDPAATTPGGSDGGDAGHGTTDHGDDVDGAAMDAVMVESMLAFPAETEGVGNPVLEPTILPDGTKEFELTAAITPWEVAPGVIVDAWTYNGVVPAPQIRVDVGDKVRVILHNETPMGTDIHWHGIVTPNDQDGVSPYTQPVIASGESYTYEFVTQEPAIGMYHAHLHGQVSVVNGMFGAFFVGDNPIPRGRTISGVTIPEDVEVVKDFPMVVNDAGVIGLTLNGKSFPATEPIVVAEGDWVSVHYFNEGLTPHPMHLHRFPQLVYAKDGIPLDEPYWADTINVAPGERYSVLFHAESPGTWVWHCHILTHAERASGMFGMVTAVVVEPST